MRTAISAFGHTEWAKARARGLGRIPSRLPADLDGWEVRTTWHARFAALARAVPFPRTCGLQGASFARDAFAGQLLPASSACFANRAHWNLAWNLRYYLQPAA